MPLHVSSSDPVVQQWRFRDGELLRLPPDKTYILMRSRSQENAFSAFFLGLARR